MNLYSVKCLVLILTSFLFISCKKEVNIQNKKTTELKINFASDDDYKIINSTFVHLVIPAPKEFPKKFAYDNYIFDFNSKDTVFYKGLIEDIYLANYIAPISDTISFPRVYGPNKERIEKLKDKDFIKLITTFKITNLDNLQLDLNKIRNTSFFKPIPFTNTTKIEEESEIDIITYSRILYNKDKTKACFYFEKRCYGLCSFSLFAFVEKVDGIWTIKEQILDYIS